MPRESQSGHFGRWVALSNDQQRGLPASLRGRKAFVPALLGSRIVPEPSTYRALADAQEAVGRLDCAATRLGLVEEFTNMAQRLEARHSADMDGVLSSAREALATELPGFVTPEVDERLRASQLVAGESAAVARAGRPWDEVLLWRLSAMLAGQSTQDEPAWRDDVTWLGDPRDPERCLIAMPPGPRMHELTADWCRWMNAESDLLRVAKIAVALLQLALIYPVRGSAHVARLLPTMELLRAGVLQHPVLPFAGWLWQHERGFLDTARGVVDRGDLNAWLLFVATAVRAASLRQIALISRLDQVCRDMVAAVWRKSAIVTLVEALTVRPIINFHEIAAICGVSPSHAPALAERLAQAGLVTILNAKTLEGQSDDNTRGKAIYATEIVRLLGTFQPDPSS